MKRSTNRRRRRIRALVFGLAALAIGVPAAAAMPVQPGQHRDAGPVATELQTAGPPAGWVDVKVSPVAPLPPADAVDAVARPHDPLAVTDNQFRPTGRIVTPAARFVTSTTAFEWSNFAIGAGIVLCVVLAAFAGLFATRRRREVLNV